MKFLIRHSVFMCIAFASAFILGWFFFADSLLSEVWACHYPEIGPKRPVWDGYLPCMDANELGDLLAGVFAPAAFILLAVTVVMQAIELRAQREELRETRDVFNAQNKLIGSQTDAAIKSAELFAAQNGILEAQEAARLTQAQSAEFTGLLQRIETIIRTRLADRAPLTLDGLNFTGLFNKRPLVLPEGSIAAIGTATDNALFKSLNHGTPYMVYDKYGHLQAFQALIKLSERAEEMAANLGPDYEDIIAEIRLIEFTKLLKHYIGNGIVAVR